MRAVVLLLAAMVGVELYGRFVLGLCDPALMMVDPQTEYRLQPSQECRQFGNRVSINRFSMRSDELSEKRTDPKEFRVVVLGDSVVYGGTQVDQDDLATARLQQMLRTKLDRPVVVANISAGSWGPANLLAYVQKFGWFDPDVIVVVASSQDATDVPTFVTAVGSDPNFPDRRPVSALWQIVTRYLPRYLAIRSTRTTAPPTETESPNPEDLRSATQALDDLLASAKQTGARVIVAEHWQRWELSDSMPAALAPVDAVAQAEGVQIVQLGPKMQAAMDKGLELYRDYIHPTTEGQRIIAEALFDAIIHPPASAASTPSPANRPQSRPAEHP